jgi:hypothetical protein
MTYVLLLFRQFFGARMRNYMRSYIWCALLPHTCTNTHTNALIHLRTFSQLPLLLAADPDGDGLSTLLELYDAYIRIRTRT